MADTINTVTAPKNRLGSLDMARGLIMFLMALDHVRIYFSSAQFSAVDPEKTNILLFLIRWVTHYCAPGFFVIAGVAVFFYLQNVTDKKQVSKFLLVRGLWLIFLELTVIGFAWSFNPGWSWLGVIWSLGWSFVLMAALIYVPSRWLLWGSLATVFLHATVGDIYLESLTKFPSSFMAFIYAGGPTHLPLLGTKGVLYSVFPWVGYMALGFAAGTLMQRVDKERISMLVKLGAGMIVAFLLLRITNVYGNPAQVFAGWSGEFSMGKTLSETVINLLNTDKYPPSPQFALMTLGPLCLLLAAWTKYDQVEILPNFYAMLRTVGRVPFFFYIVHLYLIHMLALLVAGYAGQSHQHLFWSGVYPKLRPPEGYGYSELSVLLIWLFVCVTLYFCCLFFEKYKRKNSYWWLRYI